MQDCQQNYLEQETCQQLLGVLSSNKVTKLSRLASRARVVLSTVTATAIVSSAASSMSRVLFSGSGVPGITPKLGHQQSLQHIVKL